MENLGKRYRIGERAPYLTLRDAIALAISSPFRRPSLPSPLGTVNNYIWALRDASFEVRRGEVIGIIGRNGAGKSTLLKILSRVTKPTHGHARISGRLGSLLEVGTGFHPELTGRENIYMNGAILGMSKREIALRFDEIVAFSEIEKFIDTPVKYFSSGMYVRLAFSVAAHLEPDILIVDEVLAVGDVAFQKKCLGRMGSAAKQGRTVLFVSHNMSSVALLCKSAIVLEQGRIRSITESQQAIAEYLAAGVDRDTTVYNVENSPRPD
ncbi:MAG: ABC transporter ATP-binding protein, partial [Terracidiphilus sp.]